MKKKKKIRRERVGMLCYGLRPRDRIYHQVCRKSVANSCSVMLVDTVVAGIKMT